MVKRLPFPDWTQTTAAELSLNAEGLNEEGAPDVAIVWSGNAWFSEKSRTVKDKDGRDIRLVGSLVIKGDIAPSLPLISDGTATVASRTYDIYRVARPRNPDGSVHHTTVELM